MLSWAKNVLPEDVCEAQRCWELVRQAERMRALGIARKHILALGILPGEQRNAALQDICPIVRYLDRNEHFNFPRVHDGSTLKTVAEEILNDPKRRKKALRRARPVVTELELRKKNYERGKRIKYSLALRFWAA